MQLSGGPFSFNRFDEYERKLEEAEKKAKKDYDGDGKVESGKEEYFGSRDKAIKKAMKKGKKGSRGYVNGEEDEKEEDNQ